MTTHTPGPWADESWEQCDSCGMHYPDIYWADDEQWEAVVGDTHGGLRCPRCFKREAWALGLAPTLTFLAPPLKFSIEARPVPLGNQRTPGTRNVILFDGLPLTEQEEYAAAKAIADLRVDEEVPDWEEYLCQLLLEWETGRISPSIGMSLAVRHETEKAFRRVNSFWKEWDKRRVDALVGRTHTEDRQDGEDVG